MSESKVVNITQLEADLTSIANTIREKSGGSDALVFPDGFTNAISSLEVGGGLPSVVSALTSGEYTSAKTTSVTSYIQHGLGGIPDFVLMWKKGGYTSLTGGQFCVGAILVVSDKKLSHVVYYNSGEYKTASLTSAIANNTTFKMTTNTNGKFLTGATYCWLAGMFTAG